MHRLDKLSKDYPDIYRIVESDELSKTYSMPKSCVSYRKLRSLTEEQRKQKRVLMEKINNYDS